MNPRVIGYRSMLGYNQKEMGKKLEMSEVTYRNKEKGRIPFKDYEMEEFYKLIKEELDYDIEISDIFLLKSRRKKTHKRR